MSTRASTGDSRLPRTGAVSGRLTTSEWLSLVTSRILNRSQSGADERQLACAGDGDVVQLTYGSDRVGAKILNVFPSGQYVVIQCLWGLAGDSINDLKYNDKDLPASATASHHATGGSDSTFNTYYNTAFGTSYTDDLTNYSWSMITLPVNDFTGLAFSARIKGRKVFDPRKAVAYGGSGSHVLGTPSTWEWSDNPSLHDADFLYSTAYGAGKAVDWYSVKTAADANDSTTGLGEKRRTAGITFLNSSLVEDIAETLRAHASVFHSFTASGIKLIVDEARSADATYSHASGQIVQIVSLEKKDTGNVPTVVEVVYTDTSAVPWRDGTAEAKASGVDTTLPRRTSQVRMSGVQRYSQANREAIERLNKLRTSDLVIVFDVFDQGIKHEPGDRVDVTHPIGLTSKPFRLTEPPEYQGNNIWRLTGAEYDPAAYSNSVVSGPTYPDTGLTMPTPDRPGLNLLRNADWTEDVGHPVGFYADERATPGWYFARSGSNSLILRNYDNGHQYNFGRGGMCHYIPNFASAEYCYSGQDIPIDGANYPNLQFEVSAYCQISRANVILYARVLDAAKTTVIQDFTQSYDSGGGSYGDPQAGYVEGNFKRLWVKVDISANANKTNARWLRILVLSQANQTVGSGLYPFVAWHKAMICRAPPNVTQETATPWQDGLPSNVRGQNFPSEVTSSATDYCSIGYSIGANQYFYHAATDPVNQIVVPSCRVGDKFLLDVFAWCTDDSGAASKFNIVLTDFLRTGGSGTLFKDSGFGTGNLEIYNNGQHQFLSTLDRFTFSHQRTITISAAGEYTFAAMAGLDSSTFAGDVYIRFRVQRIGD